MIDYSKAEWPPYTCVACYVYNSLRLFNIHEDKRNIAKALKIKVPKKSDNPFDLEETDKKIKWGVTVDNAKQRIDKLLKNVAPYLGFRHIPLNMIPYQMYEEVIAECLANGLKIGIGYDFAIINSSNSIIRHVSFLNKEENRFVIEDYYIKESGLKFEFSFSDVIKSIRKVEDGFWLIGKKEFLTTEYV